jgi:outer membrane protein OmpA-like peptidoglycan-associated protein
MNMKKIIITLLSVLPLFAVSQNLFNPGLLESGKLSVGFNYGTVYDIDFPKYDIDPNSPDLSSSFGDASFSFLTSLNYSVTPSFSVGANWGMGSIYGENNVVYYNGEYSQYNLSTRLNLFKLNDKLLTYGRLGFGVIAYSSELFLVDGDASINVREADALKSNMALGAEYAINQHWAVNFDASYERVADNGFDSDSWNLGTGSDLFLHMTLGINYTIGSIPADKSEVRFEEMKSDFTAANKACKTECDKVNSVLDAMEQRIADLELERLALENTDFKAVNTITENLKSRLFFKADSDAIEITAYPVLNDLVSYMKKYQSWTALVVGYSDSDASNEHNNKLSKRRAKAVMSYIETSGVQSFRLTMDYKGESAPFVPNDNESNKQLNRRVEIIITK